MPKGCIIYCIEKGALEKYTLLSIASIKEYGGFLKEYDVFCLQPRKEFPISKSVKAQLEALNTTFIDQPLNINHQYYAIVNKPLAISYVMEQYDYDQYIFFDGDTIILNEPINILEGTSKILLSPVYTKGIGISDLQDKNAAYWRHLFKLANVDTNHLIRVKTRIEGDEIIGYWNAGIMVINGKSTLIEEWKNLTIELLEKQTFPESGIFFVEQSALATTIHAKEVIPDELHLSHNFPLNKEIFGSTNFSQLQEICIAHHLGNLDLLNSIPSLLLSQNKKNWVMEKLDEYKMMNNGFFENWSTSYFEVEKKLKERFYYFIYKFTSRKK